MEGDPTGMKVRSLPVVGVDLAEDGEGRRFTHEGGWREEMHKFIYKI